MRVIYVNSDVSLHSLMSAHLGLKFDCAVVHTAEQALSLMEQGDKFKAFIVANNKGKGIQFLTEVRKKLPLTVRVLISGGGMSEEIEQAISNGDITRYVENPCNMLQLVKDLEHDISLLPFD